MEKSQLLSLYRKLLVACQGIRRQQREGRFFQEKIREAFKTNMNLTDTEAIESCLAKGQSCLTFISTGAKQRGIERRLLRHSFYMQYDFINRHRRAKILDSMVLQKDYNQFISVLNSSLNVALPCLPTKESIREKLNK